MASLQKTYHQQKLLGQVYTPRWVVEKILKAIGFQAIDLCTKKILDTSCGDGRFLVVLVEQILEQVPRQFVKLCLENIYGWDIDETAVEACKNNLQQIINQTDWAAELGEIQWKMSHQNSLQKLDSTEKFDFIVGNPPYIRIQHLSKEERTFVQQHYQFCKKGATDTYIAFYELSVHLLTEEGIAGLITPNTFLYSETAQALRQHFASTQTLRQITNYGTIQVFDNATTYSAITVFGKKAQADFLYEQAENTQSYSQKRINYQDLAQQKTWQLSTKTAPKTTFEGSEGTKLKELCKIHVGVTTLCDKAYIIKQISPSAEDESLVIAQTALKGEVLIEKALLRPIVKASKLKNNQEIVTEYILFPYSRKNGKHQIIPENDLQNQYPLAYTYLLSVKEVLDKRDNGKPNAVAWYAFGRSQGLDTSFGQKILFSPMNPTPNFVWFPYEDYTFYSGYCIKYEGDNALLLKELNSERLAQFIAVSSRDFRGGWKAYNKKVLEEFTVNL
ncbi:MAG: Eco57I restriction-modification methylase domain-containing protein [Thermoflexibacteraceae bacterium]